MDLSFNSRMEAYYQKFIELQEKLRNSEEERLKLEMKFNEMVQVAKEEEQLHYRKLRSQYKRFLEEDRKRQERNERIIRTLERVETRISMLSSKTERFKMLRRQYQSYLQRISRVKPPEKREISPPKIVIDTSHELYDTADQNKDLRDKRDLNKTLGKSNDETIEILDKYLQNLSSQKCRDAIDNNRKDPNSSLRYLNEISKNFEEGFNSNQANSIADDIMNSICSRHYKKELDDPRKLFSVPNFSDCDIKSDKFSNIEDFNKIHAAANKLTSDPISLHLDSPEINKRFHSSNIPKTNLGQDNTATIGKGLFNKSSPISNDFAIEQKFRTNKANNYSTYPSSSRYGTTQFDLRNIKSQALLDSSRIYDNERKSLGMDSSAIVDPILNKRDNVVFSKENNYRDIIPSDSKNNQYVFDTGPSKTEIDIMETEKENSTDKLHRISMDESNSVDSFPCNVQKVIECIEPEKKSQADIEVLEKNSHEDNIQNEVVNNNNEDYATVKELSGVLEQNPQIAENHVKLKESSKIVEGITCINSQKYEDYSATPNNKIPEQTAFNTEQYEEIPKNLSLNSQKYEDYPTVESNSKIPEQTNMSAQQHKESPKNLPLNSQKFESYPTAKPNSEISEKTVISVQQHKNIPNNQDYNVVSENIALVPRSDNDNDNMRYVQDVQFTEQQGNEFVPQYNADQELQDNTVTDIYNNDIEYDQYGRPIEYDQYGNQITYDENGESVQPQYENYQYNEKELPYSQNLSTHFDESGQPIEQQYHDGQTTSQYGGNDLPVDSYNQQYDNNNQQHYDEAGELIQQHDQNGQQQYDEQYGQNGQPINQYGQIVIQYDENGQPLHQYDENGQIIQHYDENGQVMDMYNQPIQYDENGQPLLQYDENGQPMDLYNENQAGHEYQQSYQEYNTDGQNFQQYDENKQIYQYDNNSEVPQFDEKEEDTEAPQQYGETDQQFKQFQENEERVNQYKTNDQVPQEYSETSHSQQEASIERPEEQPRNVENNEDIVQDKYNSEEQSNNLQNEPPAESSKSIVKEDGVLNSVIEESVKIPPQKEKNVLDMLDTDTESVKQNTSKISNNSDFDFSNG